MLNQLTIMELEHQIDNNGEYLNFRDDIMQRIRSAQYEAMRAVNKEMLPASQDIAIKVDHLLNQV